MSTTPAPPRSAQPETAATSRGELAEALVRRHGDRLRAIAYANGARGEDLEDALQSALALFLAHFDAAAELALPWFATTLKRTCWRQARTRARHPETSFVELASNRAEGDEADQFRGEALDPAELVGRGEEIRRQRAALEALPREQRLVLVCIGLELSHAEIAELTGLNRRQIRRYVEKGRAALERALVDEPGGAGARGGL